MTKNNRQIVLMAFLLGWAADWLFYGKPVGVSMLLFVLMAVGVLWRNGRNENARPIRQNLWLVLPLIFFALMAFVRANAFLTTLNVFASLALLSYLVYFYTAGRVHGVSLIGSWLIPLRVGGHSLATARPVVMDTIETMGLQTHGRKQLLPILRGGLLALPILVVFTGLLTSADLVFADYVDNALSLEIIPELVEGVWRGILILGAGWIFAGAITFSLRRRSQIDEESGLERLLQAIPRKITLGFLETVTIFTLVDLLFLGFVSVQFTYLFGGNANIDATGYTFSDYARRGFFELVVVAILSLAMILGFNWLTMRRNKRQIRWFNGLSSIMIGFVLVMLLSAFQRMRLYESTYGYTELRLIVTVFMIWLAALLVWFLVTQWRRPDRFAIGFIGMAIGFLVTLNLINPDLFIANQNLARYQASGSMDVAYLTTLSDDAVPALLSALPLFAGDKQEVLIPQCSPGWGEIAVETRISSRGERCYETPATVLRDALVERYQFTAEDSEWRRWQAYHVARHRAFNLLRESFGEIVS
ncbi:MAG: DUF4173 domain-containing protein [Chloroflexi bacterium]|nr:DUF4173 domain-containing protein [Chloroflexota bacterium]